MRVLHVGAQRLGQNGRTRCGDDLRLIDNRPLSTPRLEVLRRFAEAVVHERGFVGDAAVDSFLRAGFTKAQVLEVVLAVATKTLSNYVNHITHTPLDAFMAETRWVAPRNKANAA
jgi:hypothetical protein